MSILFKVPLKAVICERMHISVCRVCPDVWDCDKGSGTSSNTVANCDRSNEVMEVTECFIELKDGTLKEVYPTDVRGRRFRGTCLASDTWNLPDSATVLG